LKITIENNDLSLFSYSHYPNAFRSKLAHSRSFALCFIRDRCEDVKRSLFSIN